LSNSASPFYDGLFYQGSSYKLLAWGWLWTVILLISTSWVARITGMSHQRLASHFSLKSPLIQPTSQYRIIITATKVSSHHFTYQCKTALGWKCDWSGKVPS
jgi:hypothetical protein